MSTFPAARGVPTGRALTAPSTRARIASLPWWIAAGGLVLAGIVWQSKLDPSIRFQLKQTGGEVYNPSWFTTPRFGEFSPADATTVLFCYLALLHRFVREGGFHISRRVIQVTLLIGIPVACGVAVGISNNTRSPFGDWRDLLVGFAFAVGLWSVILVNEESTFRFARLFVVLCAGYAATQLLEFAQGGGAIAFYGRTPEADHAVLEYMVAAVGISMALLRARRNTTLFWWAIALCASVVLLSFRRYAWVELGTVFVLFALFSSGHHRRTYIGGAFGLVVVGMVVMFLTSGSLNWAERIGSLDPFATKEENTLARTNSGHLDEIYDGMDQINQHPLMGLGVGVLYEGERTARWKGDAGMVHNGPIEMWIKFTILGLFAFFAVYWILFRDVWRRRRGARYSDLIAWGGGAFLFGQFLVTATVYAWPFGVWEKSILVFTVLAVMFPRHVDEPRGEEA